MSTSSRTQVFNRFAQVLQEAQATPEFLAKNSTSLATFPLSLLGGQTESAELWNTYEKLLIACLQSGDEKSAHMCLERLIDRFGPSNEKVMALKGLYQEATAKSQQELEQVLQEYNSTLASNPINIPVLKRKVTLLQSLSRHAEAIKALVDLLDFSPSDAEAWMELAELYFKTGLYDRAVFCLEEVLMIAPNAWNIHARLGEILYIMATADGSRDNADVVDQLTDSIHRFCRSIELCDDYLRGYYGLKMATETLVEKASVQPSIPAKTIKELNDKATETLLKLINQKDSGYADSELAAARRLLEDKS